MGKRIWVIGIICFWMAVGVATTWAQEAMPEQTGWPIEQECIGEPELPPKGWKWDGRIFVQGDQGIRVLDNDMATPYFALFNSPFIYGAAVSPDGKWYAIPTGYQGYETMVDSSFVVEGIQVISTDINRTTHAIPWQYYGSGTSEIYSVPRIWWLDDDHIVYVSGTSAYRAYRFIINPFTGETTSVEDALSPANASFSPDSQRAIQYPYQSDGTNNQSHLNVYSMPDATLIGTAITKPETLNSDIIWLRDSSGFIASTYQFDNPDKTSVKLNLYDRDAQVKDVLFSSNEHQSIQNIVLSPDNRHLAFTYQDGHLYIADLNKKQVVDTCETVDSLNLFDRVAWSPDGSELAFSSDNHVLVLTVESHKLYVVADSIGQVVAWGQKS